VPSLASEPGYTPLLDLLVVCHPGKITAFLYLLSYFSVSRALLQNDRLSSKLKTGTQLFSLNSNISKAVDGGYLLLKVLSTQGIRAVTPKFGWMGNDASAPSETGMRIALRVN